MKIAVLGAQGSGKTQLADELSHCLQLLNDVKIIITDAPPLMAAIYDDLLHGDQMPCDLALADHKIYDLTLVCGLDIPCSSGWQHRDGSISREAVDTRLRVALTRGKIAYTVIYGQGSDRVHAALKAIASLRTGQVKPHSVDESQRQWSCEKCSDPECEHRMFTGLLRTGNRQGRRSCGA